MTIREVFDRHVDIPSIEKMAKEIIKFEKNFVIRDDEHISFFGSALMGVHKVGWFTADTYDWAEMILGVDDLDELQRDLHNLSTVSKEWKVGGDAINLSIPYVLYLINTSKLKKDLKYDSMKACIKVLYYKFLVQIQRWYFRVYQADIGVATAALDAMDNNFELKVEGTWGQVIDKRADRFLDKSSIHRDTIKSMSSDKSVVYIATDIDTKIRQQYVAYRRVFERVKDSRSAIFRQSAVFLTESGVVVRDVKRTYNDYIRYLTTVVSDRNDFIKGDLLEAILPSFNNADIELVNDTLLYISENFDNKRRKYIRKLIEDMLLYSIEYIRNNKLKTGDLYTIMFRLKSMITGSRVIDDKTINLRNSGDKLVLDAANKKISGTPAAERTTVLIYIILRVLAKNKYS